MDKNDRRLLDALAELDRRGIQHERGEGFQRNFFDVWRADSPTARATVTRSMVEMDPGGVEMRLRTVPARRRTLGGMGGMGDKAKQTAQNVTGKAKETAGNVTDDESLELEGEVEQTQADIERAEQETRDQPGG